MQLCTERPHPFKQEFRRKHMRHAIVCLKTLFIMAAAISLTDITANATDKQASCQFEHPDHMGRRLAIKYKQNEKEWIDFVSSYSRYTYWLDESNKADRKRFTKCEEGFRKSKRFLSLDKKLQSYLFENYKYSISGVNIEGGDYRKGNFLMFSSCQMHDCISNIHTDIIDKYGNMVAVILYQYPSQSGEDGAAGQALADVLRQKHPLLYFPLEAWVFVRKGHDTLELDYFIRDAIAYFEKESETTILAIHDISDE